MLRASYLIPILSLVFIGADVDVQIIGIVFAGYLIAFFFYYGLVVPVLLRIYEVIMIVGAFLLGALLTVAIGVVFAMIFDIRGVIVFVLGGVFSLLAITPLLLVPRIIEEVFKKNEKDIKSNPSEKS